MKILGIETSCDDTGVAIVEDGRNCLANVIASQEEMHAKYGGIVPEIASRQHLFSILPAISSVLEKTGIEYDQLDAVAVTNGPGLAGSLLVGVNFAKGIAFSKNIMIASINHLEGHIYSAWLGDVDPEIDPGFPLLCLIASGGHTELVLMNGHGNYETLARTRDDAVGEAFDKGARLFGMGFPGGPEIEKLASRATGADTKFTRPVVKNSLDFSFSGLKTALLRRLETKMQSEEFEPENIPFGLRANIAKEYQDALVDSLVSRTLSIAKERKVKGIIVCGGVAANSLLRDKIYSDSPFPVIIPEKKYCTDNGAMIGAAAWYKLRVKPEHQWDMDIVPSLRIN
ncbi:MAG: tRNA (adenosine(37)-N6)-threonylcarbamoyltransferase complex transferase subunit TsaD [SAR202 cluster bacterium]|nr:tRNA (adenosine(37)-N6)-threonylcarbamoyltransferase complex transferase subunit TsaD [SAR202 cluster bacterium]